MPKPPSVRERIVRATLQIIADEGIAQITNRRIAEEARVSLGSVTYHFATQRDLLRESLRLFVAEETRRFAELAVSPCDAPVDLTDLTDLAGVLDHVAATTSTSTAGNTDIAPYELYLQAGRDPELRAAADECFGAYDQLAASLLGALGVKDAERLAAPLVAMVIGLQLRRLATGSPAVGTPATGTPSAGQEPADTHRAEA
ncbi:TetR/AcrR family transcriptional regulator [Streptacidiphilus anmyonensis]|uniref:TetR/AcrR family transcriptional regulator n=1 Tax=Streptacidiphilus anmyonensis TaxID=405782 RepID=UPI0007C67344|nr:TetR/AcrR family transcriptional regulator [Streptacidiphilus anmyonensis]